MTPAAWGLLAAVAVLSAAGTGWVRAYALRRSLLDRPNERSSHTLPTPRGGGLAIVIAAALGLGAAAQLAWIPLDLAAALLGGGLLVAGVGWADDVRPLPARIRFAVHLLASVWAVAILGGVSSVRLGVTLPLGVVGHLLAVLTITWMINLYNFMDGIDGLAGGEAVTVSAIGAILLGLHGAPGVALASAIVGAAALGFLPWNWPPARIFMGDVGSGTLGFAFGVLLCASERAGAVPGIAWVALLGVFVFDATITLLRRLLRGEQWYAAHRSHAYQRAARALGSHRPVTVIALLMTAVLGGCVALAIARPAVGPVSAVAVVALLAGAYLRVERMARM